MSLTNHDRSRFERSPSPPVQLVGHKFRFEAIRRLSDLSNIHTNIAVVVELRPDFSDAQRFSVVHNQGGAIDLHGFQSVVYYCVVASINVVTLRAKMVKILSDATNSKLFPSFPGSVRAVAPPRAITTDDDV